MKTIGINLLYNNKCVDFKECRGCPFDKNTVACNLLVWDGETETVKDVIDMITESYNKIEKLINRKEDKK